MNSIFILFICQQIGINLFVSGLIGATFYQRQTIVRISRPRLVGQGILPGLILGIGYTLLYGHGDAIKVGGKSVSITNEMQTPLLLFYIFIGLSTTLLPYLIAFRFKGQSPRIKQAVFVGMIACGWIIAVIWIQSSSFS